MGDAWWKLSSQPELLQQLMVQADHGDSNEPECVQLMLEKATLLSSKPFLALLQPPSLRPLLRLPQKLFGIVDRNGKRDSWCHLKKMIKVPVSYLTFMLLMPMASPSRLIRGPPELPKVIAASVCIYSGTSLPCRPISPGGLALLLTTFRKENTCFVSS